MIISLLPELGLKEKGAIYKHLVPTGTKAITA